ncbi:MAG: radical SAM protein [Thermoplasmata archaeon]
MRTLLSTPPGNTMERWPPLGLLYIASNTRSHSNHEVKIIDAFCENLTKEQLIERAIKERPDVFGMNCSTHLFLDTMDVLREIKKALPETKLVLGGYHATFAAKEILAEYPFVDYILKGEAEFSFPMLLDRIKADRPAADVPGISYAENGALVDRPFELIQDLDRLPFPDRSMLGDLKYGYMLQSIKLTAGKFTTICTSRGCPFKCRYCSCASFSLRKWRSRSAKNVVDEIETIRDLGYESVTLVDDNFTQDRKRVEQICELLRKKHIRLQYYFEGRVDNASYDMLKVMKRVGFNVIYFGVESASQHVLDYYDKRSAPEKAAKAIENAKKAGMLVVTSFIFGAPIETIEDIEKSIGFIRLTKPHAVQINILDCLVGTPIWEEMRQKGLLSPDSWKKNHRVYEFEHDGLSEEELLSLVRSGYHGYIEGWKSARDIVRFLKTLMVNSSARRIVLTNLFNPDVRKVLSEDVIGDRKPDSR